MYSTAGQLGIEGDVIIPKGQKGEGGSFVGGGAVAGLVGGHTWDNDHL